jgi:GNAT superfamily N-acetyltransferase
MEVVQVVEAHRKDFPALAGMLAEAFFDDPVSVYFYPRDAGRREFLRRFFMVEMEKLFGPGTVVEMTSDGSGAAIWAMPGVSTSPLAALAALAPLAFLLRARVPRAVWALMRLDARHPRSAPHYYLATIGVAPSRQGQGLGSALLRSVLSRADEEGVPAYLESSKESNVPFYARHGFEVIEEVKLPLSGPRVWLMWREPTR